MLPRRIGARPVAQAITGNLLLGPKALRSFGLKTVWVVNVGSESINALYGPVPPSSMVRDVGLSDGALGWATEILLKLNAANAKKTKRTYFFIQARLKLNVRLSCENFVL